VDGDYTKQRWKGAAMSEYKFEKFIGIKPAPRGKPMPQNMTVGQIVVRYNVKSGTISGLKCHMRRAMAKGASFSVDQGKHYYAIRRDT
jgi:hypothetical protein